MSTYTNGQIPNSVVSVVTGGGYDSKGRYWEHRLTPAMAQRWARAVQYAVQKWGVRMGIRAGANAYRNRAWQVIARADACASGNCNGASAVGYSSHGGNWQNRDCLAIDVNPNGLSWAQVWEACRAAGFACGLITEAISGIRGGEPWHIIDFAAFAAPAGGGSIPFPTPIPEEEDQNMSFAMKVAGDAARGPIEIVPGFQPNRLTDEEFDNYYGGKAITCNARQYDVNVARNSRLTSTAPEVRDAFIGHAPNRGYAFFAPGYVKGVNDEERANNPFTTRTVEGNDRQFDLWVSQALRGEAAAFPVTIEDGDGDVVIDIDYAKIAADTSKATRAEFAANPLK